jgi:hypothetical protein
MKIMKVKITEFEGVYRADCLDLPGMPPVGVGMNKYEAMGSLVFALRHDMTWHQYGWPAIEVEE